jgi:DNA repair protein RecN (Recombination protein N)
MVLGGERGAVDLLAAAEQALARVALHDDALRQVRDRIEAARHEVSDINDGLSREPIEYDDASLTEKRARLAQLASMKRRYGQDETEMLAYLASARTRVQELESAEDDAAALEEEAAAHLKLAEDLADRLTSQRKAAAERLALEVTDRLTALALPEARFEVGLTPCELSEHGAERVSFLFTANPGESSRPLAKVASGGELSRVSLAIHLTAYAGSARTLIFDEVDAGVGGRAATEVGRALSRLARTREVQVIVVTHLPQVAAFASEHHRVTKRTSGGHTDASVDLVEGDERVAELSRMMAGVPGSATAQEHARELLTLASGRTK